MNSTATLEGVKKAIFFPFSGRSWGEKLLIGSALYMAIYLIPILPLIPLYGYFYQIASQVILKGEDPSMPDWKDWGNFFSNGIKLFGAQVLYSLPGTLIVVIGYILMFAGNFAFMFDPRILTSPDTFGQQFAFGSMLGLFAGMITMMLGMVLLVASGLIFSPAAGHMIAKSEFKAAFAIKEWWPIFKANFSGYLLAIVISYGVYMALASIIYVLYFSVILCFLMPIAFVVIAFLKTAIQYALISVTYRDAIQKLGSSNTG